MSNHSAITCLVVIAVLLVVGLRTNATGVLQPGATPDAGVLVVDVAEYASLQSAIDALPATGGIIRIPPGVYEIDRPLKVTQEDVHIEGSGTATHLHNTNSGGEPTLIIETKYPGEPKRRQWRIQLSNMRITGTEKSGHGIVASNVNEIFINGVTVSDHGGDGIRLDHCYEDPRICNSLITYNKGVGLNLIGCHDIVVAASQFEENHDALHCIDGFNLCMTGCCVDDHLQHGVVIENTYGSVVSGNMIEECKGTAVVLDRDCYGITISANVIAHDGAGIDLRDAHGCTVSANTLTIMHADALRIGPKSGRITVTGNNFSNSYVGDDTVKRRKNDLDAAGLVLEATSDIAVTGNVFASVTPKAVELRNGPSRRVAFAGNVLTDVESEHGGLTESVVGQIVE